MRERLTPFVLSAQVTHDDGAPITLADAVDMETGALHPKVLEALKTCRELTINAESTIAWRYLTVAELQQLAAREAAEA